MFVNNILYNTVGYAFYLEGNSIVNAKAIVETSNYNNLLVGTIKSEIWFVLK